jgi:hypothetical protein
MAVLVANRVYNAPVISFCDPDRAERQPGQKIKVRPRWQISGVTEEKSLEVERHTNADAADISIHGWAPAVRAVGVHGGREQAAGHPLPLWEAVIEAVRRAVRRSVCLPAVVDVEQVAAGQCRMERLIRNTSLAPSSKNSSNSLWCTKPADTLGTSTGC